MSRTLSTASRIRMNPIIVEIVLYQHFSKKENSRSEKCLKYHGGKSDAVSLIKAFFAEAFHIAICSVSR
jgi:hypothetical protein